MSQEGQKLLSLDRSCWVSFALRGVTIALSVVALPAKERGGVEPKRFGRPAPSNSQMAPHAGAARG